MSDSQKAKLSAVNKGKTLSQETKDKISRALERYWSRLPYKPEPDSSTTSSTENDNITYYE